MANSIERERKKPFIHWMWCGLLHKNVELWTTNMKRNKTTIDKSMLFFLYPPKQHDKNETIAYNQLATNDLENLMLNVLLVWYGFSIFTLYFFVQRPPSLSFHCGFFVRFILFLQSADRYRRKQLLIARLRESEKRFKKPINPPFRLLSQVSD